MKEPIDELLQLSLDDYAEAVKMSRAPIKACPVFVGAVVVLAAIAQFTDVITYGSVIGIAVCICILLTLGAVVGQVLLRLERQNIVEEFADHIQFRRLLKQREECNE